MDNNFICLLERMKLLPNNMMLLILKLEFNSLGENVEKMKWVAKLMKQFPINLQNFMLFLSGNDIGGGKAENFKILVEGIKQLP